MYSQNVANTYIASSGLSFWCFNSVLIVEVLVQKVFALDSTVYNANLLAKAKAISNDVRNMLASFPRSTPPASMDNVKEGTAFSNWIIPLRGKPMPPLVSIKNPILQLHPSFTNLERRLNSSCWRPSCSRRFWLSFWEAWQPNQLSSNQIQVGAKILQ